MSVQSDLDPSHSNSGTEDVGWLLDRVEALSRGPNGYQEAWNNNDDPVGELFKGDFVTWVAFYATKLAVYSPTHFCNKSMLKRKFDALIKSDTENQEKIARQLRVAIKDPLLQKLRQWQARLGMPGTQTNHSNEERLSNTGVADNHADDNAQAPVPIARSTTPGLQLHHNPETISINRATVEEHALYGASLHETSHLCPSYLAGAVRRVPHPVHHNLSAGIGMAYPNGAVGAKFGYSMGIEIRANKIDHIASNLFGAHFEIDDDGTRYLCLPGGTTVLPNPSITLSGCRMDAILPTFGLEIYKAVIAGPMYQDDAQQVLEHTRAVKMVVSHRSAEYATIILSLGLMQGTFIADRLYNM
ncbi:hypothetical protein LZ32DRAFT_595484 [Colletotrichum eremochloae]|nr:hypothetical protein LZ32DRAFT_595484 [Colletotrichum eremochloae]